VTISEKLRMTSQASRCTEALEVTSWRLVALIVFAMTAMATVAQAVDPGHAIDQYGHRAWRIGEAGLDHEPTAIAQTTDGQLWVGTTDGLYQFDGKRFSRWVPTDGPPLRLGFIGAVFGARNGDLYIAAQTGIFRVSNGRYFQFEPKLIDGHAFTEDNFGRVWLARPGVHSSFGLCMVGPKDLKCYGSHDGLPCTGFGGVAPEGSAFWLGGPSSICRWSPGQQSRVDLIGKSEEPVIDLTFDANHSLWAAFGSGGRATGLWHFETGMWKPFSVPGFDSRDSGIERLLGDRHGSLWVSSSKGLYRIRNRQVSRFDHLDGLSGESVFYTFEDREGSIWAATDRGIDQFFDQPIVPFGAREGLGDTAVRLAPAVNGSILVGGQESIYRIAKNGGVSHLTQLLRYGSVADIFSDSIGRIWYGNDNGLLMFEHKKKYDVSLGPDGLQHRFYGIVEDNGHNIWAVGRDLQTPPDGWLWPIDLEHPLQPVPSPLGADQAAVTGAASDLAGGLWLAIGGHVFYHMHNGQFETIASLAAEPSTPTAEIVPIAPGEAWFTTRTGVAWLQDGRTRLLDMTNGLPCDTVYGLMFDDARDLWLTTGCGLVRVSTTELDRWRREPGYHVKSEFFGSSSGYSGDQTSRLAKSTDGKLWFAGSGEVYEVDPVHIHINELAPPVQVQGMEADQRPYAVAARTVLPKLTHNLEIDYAALSYVQPDLLKFRYRLFGHDRDWTDVGNRRQAFYNDLPPGPYRFQVTACNKDGVCNDRGATVTIVIPPAWWQTWWFRALCALVTLAVIAAAILWRMNTYGKQMRVRFDDRLQERTRVARDLHDTLMQTVLASKLLVDNSKDVDSLAKGRAAFVKLSGWLELAAEEGRAVLDSLRASTAEGRDLAEALEQAALEARADRNIDTPILVTGHVCTLHPIVRNEVQRIGVEAIRNACVHSGASYVIVALDYARDLTLRVRDDGQGIDEALLSAGRSGHFGLVGMRERAELVGATLTITSSPMGTEITLVVPKTVAFTGTLPWSTKSRRLCRSVLR
jgi:ligand-binding sensor domain-containing protein